MQYYLVRIGALVLTLLTQCVLANGLGDAPSGNYLMDNEHGYVTFSYLHQGYSRPRLRFNSVDAKLDLDADNVANSKVVVNIDPASIDSGVERFDDYLRGDTFFDVETFDSIDFVSTGISATGDDTYQLTGDLTVKGVTRPWTMNVRFNKAGKDMKTKQNIVGFSATGTMMRKDWNLGAYVPLVGNEITVSIEAEFRKQN